MLFYLHVTGVIFHGLFRQMETLRCAKQCAFSSGRTPTLKWNNINCRESKKYENTKNFIFLSTFLSEKWFPLVSPLPFGPPAFGPPLIRAALLLAPSSLRAPTLKWNNIKCRESKKYEKYGKFHFFCRYFCLKNAFPWCPLPPSGLSPSGALSFGLPFFWPHPPFGPPFPTAQFFAF